MISDVLGFKIQSDSRCAKENIYCILDSKTVIKHPDVSAEDHYFDILRLITSVQEQA